MPILHKEPSPTWCHDHLTWECWWIDGIGEEIGTAPLTMCHNPITDKTKPWCKDHVPAEKTDA